MNLNFLTFRSSLYDLKNEYAVAFLLILFSKFKRKFVSAFMNILKFMRLKTVFG